MRGRQEEKLNKKIKGNFDGFVKSLDYSAMREDLDKDLIQIKLGIEDALDDLAKVMTRDLTLNSRNTFDIYSKEYLKFKTVDIKKRKDEIINAINKAKQEYKKLIASKVTKINETTRKAVARAIKENLEGKYGLNNLRKQIEEKVGSKWRAKLISQLETRQQCDLSSYELSKKLDLPREWRWVPGSKTPREHHQAMSGEQVKGNQRYSNGLRFPHDPEADISETAHCNCIEL